MNRIAIGAALGGLAVYLYDPESGEDRRRRLFSVWREKRENALQAGRAAGEAVESARPLAGGVARMLGRRGWMKNLERGRPTASLRKLIGAAAIGGALVYLLDPAKGSERRQRLLSAWQEKVPSALEMARQGARQMAEAVKPHLDQLHKIWVKPRRRRVA